MVIAKTTSRNATFKATKMGNFVLKRQSAVMMCEATEVGLFFDKKEALECWCRRFCMLKRCICRAAMVRMAL